MAEAQNCELGVTSKAINLGSRNSGRQVFEKYASYVGSVIGSDVTACN